MPTASRPRGHGSQTLHHREPERPREAVAGTFIASAAVADPTRVWFKPRKYRDRLVWIEGAGREYLRTLPWLEEHHHKAGADNPNLTAQELIRRANLEDED